MRAPGVRASAHQQLEPLDDFDVFLGQIEIRSGEEMVRGVPRTGAACQEIYRTTG
jgi:hypothetical protein